MLAENTAAVRRAVAHFNSASEREQYFDLYDPDCEVNGLPLGLPGNFTGLQKFYRGVWAAFPDISITVEDIFGSDDSLAVRFDAEGTHTGDFFGMAATGKQTTFFVILLLRFRNVRVIERWSQMSIIE